MSAYRFSPEAAESTDGAFEQLGSSRSSSTFASRENDADTSTGHALPKVREVLGLGGKHGINVAV